MRSRTLTCLGVMAFCLSSNLPAAAQIEVDSTEMEERLIYRETPVYPREAREQRIQGVVLIDVVIDEVGQVAEWEVSMGHPLLAEAAVEAISQWLYDPYALDGEPVEVSTTVTINFQLR